MKAEGDYLYYRRDGRTGARPGPAGRLRRESVRPPSPRSGGGGAAPARRQGSDPRAGVMPGGRGATRRGAVPAPRRLRRHLHRIPEPRPSRPPSSTSTRSGRSGCSGRSREASTARRSARSSSRGHTASPTTAMGPQVRFLDPDDTADLDDAFANADDVAAVFLEPIAGEGGVKPLPAAFAARLRERVRARTTSRSSPTKSRPAWDGPARSSRRKRWASIPTTSAWASRSAAGWSKIGALLVKRAGSSTSSRSSTRPRSPRTTSAAAIALKALQVLDATTLMRAARDRRPALLDALETVRARYPQVIKEVRGTGHDGRHRAARSVRGQLPHPADALAAGPSGLHGGGIHAQRARHPAGADAHAAVHAAARAVGLRDRSASCSARRRHRNAVPRDRIAAISRT